MAKGTNQLWIAGPTGPAFYMDLHMVVTERHSSASDATEHAVERGAAITDHVIEKPQKVTFEVFITNQPLEDDRMVTRNVPLELPSYPGPAFPTPGAIFGAVESLVKDLVGSQPKTYSATLTGFEEDHEFVVDALEKLEGLKRRADLCSLFTAKASYENMVLTGLEMARGASDGDGATFNLTFTRIRVVETRQTRAPASSLIAAKPPANKGTQTATEKTPRQSALVKLGVPGVVRPGI